MVQSESVVDVLGRLTEAQAEMPTVEKGKQAGFGRFSYKYADFDSIVRMVRPILHKHGLAFMQSVSGGDVEPCLTTRVFSVKGEYIEDTVAIPAMDVVRNSSGNASNNNLQRLGMAITYMKRYALCAMLGITSDEDVDAYTPPAQNTQSAQPSAQPKAQPSVQKKPLKGGDSTAEEQAKIRKLCAAEYGDGVKVFSNEEVRAYLATRTERTAAELIKVLTEQIGVRTQPPVPDAIVPSSSEIPF